MKFNENPSNRSRVFICGHMDGRTNRWTDMTKLIVAFRNFANEPKNVYKQTGAFRKQQHCYFKTVKKCP